MLKRVLLAAAALSLVALSAGAARAEVRLVRMKIDGYLCGN